MADTITVNGTPYSPLDFLLGDADKLAFEAKDLPTKSVINVSRARAIHTHNQSTPSSSASLTTYTATRTLSRSKRKVMYTVSGEVVAIAATVAAVAIIGGPVTWAVVGGAALAAAVGIAASYALKKAIRGTRAYYYTKMYITEENGRKSFVHSHEALNGIRYILKKRNVSAISDDVKELWKAIGEYNKRKGKPIGSCRDALELAYWYDRVWYLHERLADEMDLFIQYYNYLHEELNKAFVTDKSALNKANAANAIRKIHSWVNKDYQQHHKNVCGSSFIHGTCYAHVGGKSKKPKISTFFDLSGTHYRKPAIRLWMDAVHMSKTGENSIASYDPPTLFAEVYKIFREITDNPENPLLDQNRLAPSALSSNLSGLPDSTTFGTESGSGSDSGTPINLGDQDSLMGTGSRVAVSGANRVLATGLGTSGGVVTQLQSVVPVVSQSLSTAAATSATSGGLSAVVMIPLQVAGEIKNLQIELQALEQQLKQPIAQMDVEKMMTSLRTLLKDGNVFEKCVDEIIKILKYHEEFKVANEATTPSCEGAFELAYRIVKTVKHFKVLQNYMPFFELFARIALNMNTQVAAIQNDKPYEQLTSDITLWFNTPANHANCKDSGLCYHGIEDPI
jgi:hypothetical protein